MQTRRWRPVAPSGTPHMLIEMIPTTAVFPPKGTVVFASTCSIHQDASEYHEPEAFLPERFFNNKFGMRANSKGSVDDDNHRRVTYDFGAGRRVCPGQRLAENSLVSTTWTLRFDSTFTDQELLLQMINMAKIAWAFDITADPSAPPLDLNIQTGYSDGLVFGPNPFSASFSVRSSQHRDTIEREYQEGKTFLRNFED